MVTRIVESWGRLSREPHDWQLLTDRDRVADLIAGAGSGAMKHGLAHGNGLSYGDVALNAGGSLWGTRGLDRFITFDRAAGVLECEAGVTLAEIVDLALPHGWFPAVTPGTQFVTVGGAIANDVHGKNHHRAGTFGGHVERIVLHRTDGERIECGPDERAEWFSATVGGLGLTGVISQARLKLRRVAGPWIDTKSTAFESIGQFVDLSEQSEAAWEYTVAWIDCLATRAGQVRGVLFRGNHAESATPAPTRSALRWPVTPPVSLVNRASLRSFNALYWRRQRSLAGHSRCVPYGPFFYPLDTLQGWNRMYGPRGFYQYQCVLPPPEHVTGITEMLEVIARSAMGSFLGVLKTFGAHTPCGLLSFPMPGITLALDFPNDGPKTMQLFERLDAIVRAAGGRLYPAKDARMPRELFESGYPRLAEFRRFIDPGLSSAMARRLVNP